MLALLCFCVATEFSVNKDLYIAHRGFRLKEPPLPKVTSIQPARYRHRQIQTHDDS